MFKSSGHSLWKLFENIDYYALCLGRSQQVTWANASAKDLFKDKLSLRSFKKILGKENEWVFSKAVMDAFDGRVVAKNFETTHKQLGEVNCVFFGLLEEQEDYVLVLFKKSEKQAVATKSSVAELSFSQRDIEQRWLSYFGQSFQALGQICSPQDSQGNDFSQRSQELYKCSKGMGKAGVAMTKSRATSLGTILDSVKVIMTPLFELNEIKLTFCPTKGLYKMDLNRREVELALMDLLMNALEASIESKSEKVLVDVQETRDRLEVIVTDSGHGIPKELDYRVFTPHYSLKDGASRGLGLPIARMLISKMGGTVSISRKTQDTRFVVKMPKMPQAA